jgi:hypothetical protein
MFFIEAFGHIKRFVGSTKWLALAVTGVFLWLAVATIFYLLINNCQSSDACLYMSGLVRYELVATEKCGWSFVESFYYAVQTGLSIGFGTLSETREWSQLFSVYQIISGASFIGGALSLFATKAVGQCEEMKTSMSSDAQTSKDLIHEDDKQIPPVKLGAYLVKHPGHMRRILERIEADDAKVASEMEKFKTMYFDDKCKHVADLLFRAGHILEADKGKFHDKVNYEVRMKNICEEFPATAFITQVLIVWLAVGIIYGIAAEKWSFITSLYFAVTSLSTAGLQGVSPDKQWHFGFLAIYCLIGCPLYGATLGLYANCLVAKYQERAQLAKINASLTLAETDTVEALLEHHKDAKGDSTISETEFIILELLRLGSVDSGQLLELNESFNKLDKNSSGFLNRDELWPDLARDVKKHTQKGTP